MLQKLKIIIKILGMLIMICMMSYALACLIRDKANIVGIVCFACLAIFFCFSCIREMIDCMHEWKE
jgi:hypothetical protein